MKDFLLTFFIVLVSLFLFMFFGGVLILENFYLVLIACALIASLIIFAFFRQSEKIDELEKRIEQLEREKERSE